MASQPVLQEEYRVPLWRRGAALAIDFLIVSLISSFVGTRLPAQGTLFLLGWLGLRVVLVSKNRGQSLGRWALNMRVIEIRRGSTPELLTLMKREIGLGIAAFLTLLGFLNLNPGSAWAILLLLPLAIDGIFAVLDVEQQRSLHDQYARTLVIQTQLGYSLDIKIRNLVADLQRRVKK